MSDADFWRYVTQAANTPPQNDDQARAYALEHFGTFAYYFNEPELGPLLLRAGYERWTFERLGAQIMGTRWWQTRSDAERRYDDLTHTDPAALAREINAKQADLYNMVQTLGLNRPGLDIGLWSRHAVKYGQSDEQMLDLFVSWAHSGSLKTPGLIQNYANYTRDTAAQYFMRVSDQKALDMAKRMASNELSQEAVAGVYRDQARRQYTHLAGVIDQGVTLAEYFDPHRQEIARMLEVAPDSVDFMNDTYWKRVIDTTDPDSKQRRAMTVSEAAELARRNDRWKQTDNAREMGAAMSVNLARVFGEL